MMTMTQGNPDLAANLAAASRLAAACTITSSGRHGHGHQVGWADS
jgi:hypothetical protein